MTKICITKNCIFLVFLFFLSASLFAQVIDYYDEVTENLYQEYIHEGRIPPFFYSPLLPEQVNQAANEINSPYNIVPARNGAKVTGFANIAGHLFSKEVSIEKVGKNEANNGIDYAKNYLSQPAFVGFALDFSSKIGFGGGFRLDVNTLFSNDYFSTFNISSATDQNFFQVGYLYFDNPHISLLVGRVNTQMGLLYSDAIFFNNNIPYTDSVRVYIPFGKYFNFHWQMTNIPAVESFYQKDVATGNDFKDEYEDSLTEPDYSGFYQDYFYGFEGDDFPSLILNMYQRFGFQNDFIKAGLALNVFLVRRNNRFEFVDIFPFAEWHATDVIPNNMSLGFDFAIVPVENLLFNIQFGVDEIDAKTLGFPDIDIPTIWNLIGTMQNILVAKSLNIFFSTNIGYTHYLWGNFSGTSVQENTHASLAKAIYRYHAKNPMHMPYTSSYGPGAFWASQQVIITFAENSSLADLRIAPKALFLLKETDTNLIETEYVARTELAAQTIYFSLEVPVSYKWRTLEASIAPSFHIKALSTPTTPWFELKLSLKAYFSASIFEENNHIAFDFEY